MLQPVTRTLCFVLAIFFSTSSAGDKDGCWPASEEMGLLLGMEGLVRSNGRRNPSSTSKGIAAVDETVRRQDNKAYNAGAD